MLGRSDVGLQIQRVASKLPGVHTPEAAAALNPEMEELVKLTWDFGRLCKSLNIDDLNRAVSLASSVRQGNLKIDEAQRQFASGGSNITTPVVTEPLESKPTRSGARGKRPPSAYNLFIKECAAGGKKTLAECAAEWKRMKETNAEALGVQLS